MANDEHIKILKQGVKTWNKWREDYPDIKPDLISVNLRSLDLRNINFYNGNLMSANLEGSNLKRANLVSVNLNSANLKRANLEKANLNLANLRHANFRDTNLVSSNFKNANLISTNFRGAYLNDANLNSTNLNGANLTRSNLTNANLNDANLNNAYLNNANLTGANLKMVRALEANFKGANLTGACIEDWIINNRTILDNMVCDYIYLNQGQKERRPSNPNKNFEPSEFTKLIQKSIETVDLIFTDGIDWKAFFASFKTLQEEYGAENIGVQAIERKSGDTLIVRIEVPPDANKAVIEGHTKQLYESNLKVLEDKYRSELNAKDREIEIYKQKSADILELAKLAASRPITVEAKAVAENQSKNVEVEMNFNNAVYGAAGKVEGNQNIYASEQKQTLAQAAGEIQKLLKQLESSNPTATVEQQQAYVDAAISPSIKERCVGALKAGGEVAIEEFLDNSYVNVGKAVVKGWMKPL